MNASDDENKLMRDYEGIQKLGYDQHKWLGEHIPGLSREIVKVCDGMENVKSGVLWIELLHQANKPMCDAHQDVYNEQVAAEREQVQQPHHGLSGINSKPPLHSKDR